MCTFGFGQEVRPQKSSTYIVELLHYQEVRPQLSMSGRTIFYQGVRLDKLLFKLLDNQEVRPTWTFEVKFHLGCSQPCLYAKPILVLVNTGHY